MAKDLEGKIFIVHHDRNIPAVAFVSPVEAGRIERELTNLGLHFTTREVFCFGNGLQRIFVIMEENAGTGPVLAFITGKDANCMGKLLTETGGNYIVTEIRCFSIMREQVLAKYKLKYHSGIASNTAVSWCNNCKPGYPMVTRFKA